MMLIKAVVEGVQMQLCYIPSESDAPSDACSKTWQDRACQSCNSRYKVQVCCHAVKLAVDNASVFYQPFNTVVTAA